MIECIVKFDGKEFSFRAKTWYQFVYGINDIMKEFEITFPLGEDDDIKFVTKKVKEVDKYS